MGQATLAGPLRRDRAFDLRLATDRNRRATRMRIGVGAFAALALAPVLVNDGLARRAEAEDLTAAAVAAEAHTASVRAELDDLTDARSLAADVAAAQARIAALEDQEIAMSLVVRRLAEAIPDDVYLQSLRLQRPEVGELPTGYVGPAPVALIRLDGVAPDLDGVGRWLSATETVDALDGLWLSQAALGAADDGGGGTGTVFAVDGAVIANPAPSTDTDTEEAGS